MTDKIFKDAVVCWVILKYKDLGKSKKYFIDAVPLTVAWEGLSDADELYINSDVEVIAVIPAAPGTCKVLGEMPNGSLGMLGYELPGADSPDWLKLLDAKVGQEATKNR